MATTRNVVVISLNIVKYSLNVFIQEMWLPSKLNMIFKRDLAIYFSETSNYYSGICEYFFPLYENIRLIYLKKKLMRQKRLNISIMHCR